MFGVSCDAHTNMTGVDLKWFFVSQELYCFYNSSMYVQPLLVLTENIPKKQIHNACECKRQRLCAGEAQHLGKS